jgi:hypothetical protein
MVSSSAPLVLDLLGLVRGGPQAEGDVARDLVATEGNHAGVRDRAFGEDGDVRGATADVDQGHAQALFVLLQHGLARGKRFEHDVEDLQLATAAALDHILHGRGGGGHDVHARLQAHPAHAEWLAHAVLAVDLVFLGQDVDHVAVGGQGDGARQLQHLGHVAGAHFLVLDRNGSRRVDALDVAARDAHVDLGDLAARHALGLEHGLIDGRHRRVDVDDNALLEPP